MPDHPNWATHLTRDILGWWEAHGADDAHGGVLTCFDNRGRLISEDKYTWSQGRWAWLAAELADEAIAGRLDLDAERWAARARRTADFLIDHAIVPGGTSRARVGRSGTPDASGDPAAAVGASVFADLFAVIGLAGAVRHAQNRTEAERWRTAAQAILAHAERSISAGTARTDPYPVPNGFADLAGPMNLMHASAELLRAGGDEYAEAVRDRAMTTIFGPDGFVGSTTWWEFRPQRPEDAETLLGRHRTPGHLLELLWMAHHARYQAAERGQQVIAVDDATTRSLAHRAFDLGWDEEFGGLLRYTDSAGGRPRGRLLGQQPTRYEALVRSTWDTKLWWVHAEALYATALADPGDLAPTGRRARLRDWTMSVFPDPGGEWIQIRGRDGTALDEVVALPVKDPFHIARALLLLNRLETAPPDWSTDRTATTTGDR